MQKSDEQLIHEIGLRNLSDTGDFLEVTTFAAIKLAMLFLTIRAAHIIVSQHLSNMILLDLALLASMAIFVVCLSKSLAAIFRHWRMAQRFVDAQNSELNLAAGMRFVQTLKACRKDAPHSL
ncbi:hypothetical protein CLV80_11734 [Yoonia maritima]|uniref:Uncharacterized protein n=1 Tax=Yoonia maritima TaxID=1435347 RepID=A0A2T0VTR2_9RHOB|nr:hypothetical protein [Yoonia maritima]PRY74516.1 hypothetical protein CLV80_11734 [Yoonia maritima]